MKNITLYIFSFLSAFFAGIQVALGAIFILIIIDLVFGLIAAKHNNHVITSYKLSKTAIKLFVYELLIISSHLTELYLFKVVPLVSLTIGFLGVIEFLSISEKFTSITGVPFVKYIKEIIFKKLKK